MNKKFFPKISWNHQDYKVRLYCYIDLSYPGGRLLLESKPGGDNASLQYSFDFSYEAFCYAYENSWSRYSRESAAWNQNKKRTSVDGSWNDVDFATDLSLSSKDAHLFKEVFLNFRISPSILKRLIHQDKKKARKVVLVPKAKALNGGVNTRGGARVRGHSSVSLSQDDISYLSYLKHCEEDYVLSAAKNYDLSFYFKWRRVHCDYLAIRRGRSFGAIGVNLDRKFQREFVAAVESKQKELGLL